MVLSTFTLSYNHHQHRTILFFKISRRLLAPLLVFAPLEPVRFILWHLSWYSAVFSTLLAVVASYVCVGQRINSVGPNSHLKNRKQKTFDRLMFSIGKYGFVELYFCFIHMCVYIFVSQCIMVSSVLLIEGCFQKCDSHQKVIPVWMFCEGNSAFPERAKWLPHSRCSVDVYE